MNKHRILVVDDEIDICEFLADFFVAKGYETDCALGGEEALRKVEENPPAVILLDIRMPDIDGMEVLRRVRESNPQVGVIMVTGVHDESIGREALKLGAVDFVMKPINLEYLETSVLAKIVSTLADE